MTKADLSVQLLGPLVVRRAGAVVPLPPSRKVRALLAFLALSPNAVTRARLCDLLWDVPNDPRGELRWCLSKLRSVLGEGSGPRVIATGQERVALDLSDGSVDAVEVERAVSAGLSGASQERLIDVCARFAGDFLEGTTVDGSAEFSSWLTAQRNRFRAHHVALLTELVARAPRGSEESVRRLETWLQIAPFELRPHELMLEALAKNGRVREAEAHLAAAIGSFEHEGLDWAPLRDAWRAARDAARKSVPAAALVEPGRIEIPTAPTLLRTPRRASVAVMPFADNAIGTVGRTGDGITDDVITRLAKLRALFVIARGTVYALGDRGVDAQEAGRILNVEYVVSGSVHRHDRRLSVRVELAQTQDARIVWTDEIAADAQDPLVVLDGIVDRIVSSIAEEIELAECRRAILKPPNSLDAWEAYHRGLWHMYKFTGPENHRAEEYFRNSLTLDPTFARAHAGLSFTHFQNAFLDLTPDRERQIDLALASAGESVGADDRDPAAHWAMGRAMWLRGATGEALSELERCIELSPNFALGHYTLGFVHSQSGDPTRAIHSTNHSRELSPFDPLQFAMLASRALAHIRLGEIDEAAEWAVKATGRPNAHAHILAIAASCLALANRRDEARHFVARVRTRVPSYTVEDFLRSFRFDHETENLLRKSARTIGFDCT